MKPLLRSWTAPLLALALAGVSVTACEEKKTEVAEDAGAADAGPAKPVLDGKLGAAVAAAESAQAMGQGKPGQDGPPENGVFAPGMADKAQPAGKPAKVEVVAEGAEPRFLLAVPTPGDDEQRVTLGVMVRLGGQGGQLAVDYTLGLRADRPKPEKGKADKKDEPKDDGPKKVVATVVAVSAAPQLPKQIADAIAKFKGTEIRWEVSPRGAAHNLTFTIPKDADPGLDAAVRGLVDSVSMLTTPVPEKPVGVGGYWMASDRSSSFGIDVVRYRVFKVDKIEKDHATLSVDTRLYATTADVELGAPGKGQKVNVLRFESQGKGRLEWAAGGLLPQRGEGLQKMGLLGQAQGQQAGVQTELSAKLAPAEPAKPEKK